MAPSWWKHPNNKLKKCQEFLTEACDTNAHDGCCAAAPCKLCITWETYADDIAHGSAVFDGASWTGTVAGIAFVSYWEAEIIEQPEPASVGNSVGMSFAWIEGGTYNMGSPGDEPGRDADEDHVSTAVASFRIGVTEVTQAQYLAVRGLSPSHFSGASRPVETVNFADAHAFCAAINALPAEIAAGRIYRIPTEAEWEFACRAGTTTAYNFGASSGDLATNGWYNVNSGAETHDVSEKPPNDKGLTDCHGNVWEWADNSRGDGAGGDQVIRGGSWNSDADDCRSASRELIDETTRNNTIGFRVAMYQPPPPPVRLCEYVVTFDGIEVYRATCYEGASCRNPAGEASATVNYESGTVRWSVYEPRELALIDDPDTGCRTHFCGSCHCTCDCLCVTLTEYGTGDVLTGEACDVAYDCDPPLWIGAVGYYSLEIALGRDQYGNCIITLTADGEEQEPVAAPGCGSMSASVTLANGDVISVRCKECSCEETVPLQSCCGCPSFGGNDGCIVFSVRDPCISGDRFDLNWSVGRGGMPASPTTWGTVTCEMFATINMGASIPGCGGADIDFTFVIFRVTNPDPSVQNIISDCEWAMEVYADGVYLDRYLEYTNECQVNGSDDPLAWIQFPNVDIGGLGTATVTSDFTIPNTKC